MGEISNFEITIIQSRW